MSSPSEPQQKYLRAAFSNQYNLILLSGSVSFSAALASWAPLLSGLVGEAVWLFTGPRLGAFRRRADARLERADIVRAIGSLEARYGAQALAVDRELRELGDLFESRPDITDEERLMVGRRLPALLRAFIAVAACHQRLARAAANAPLRELQAELTTLHQALATETDLGVRASLRRALSVAERRLELLDSTEAARRSLELALQTLPHSLSLLKEGAAGLSGCVDLCVELDAATSQLTRTAALEAEREGDAGGARASLLPEALN